MSCISLAQDPDETPPKVLRAHGTCSPAVSVALALGVTGLLFAGATAPRLPALEAGVLLLFVVIEHEVRTGQISRELAFSALLVVLAASSVLAGPAGLGSAVAGAGAGLALLLPVLALGGIRAGDLLAAMALAAIWGLDTLPALALWTCAAGVVLAALLAVPRALDLYGVSSASPGDALVLRRPPLSVAVGLGAAALQIWGLP